jgi:hypothetical protein
METSLQEICTVERSSAELARLICKLRWIGMEEEAKRLQAALGVLSSSERGTVPVDPPSTD